MAAVDEITVLQPTTKGLVATLLWHWILENEYEEAFHVKIWFISKTFTYEDLFPVFEKVLGPAPSWPR